MDSVTALGLVAASWDLSDPVMSEGGVNVFESPMDGDDEMLDTEFVAGFVGEFSVCCFASGLALFSDL